MPLNLQPPITYLITSGATTSGSSPESKDFQDILILVAAAVRAGVSLIQLREKNLTAKVLYELALRCTALTRDTQTRTLVNDRADIARAARADGVHLSTRSVAPSEIRSAFGEQFLIGVSTHSLGEAQAAQDSADFAVFGPVFDTPSKPDAGQPAGVENLGVVVRELAPFPIVALGGVTIENCSAVLQSGAAGVAAIRMFSNAATLGPTVGAVRQIQNMIVG